MRKWLKTSVVLSSFLAVLIVGGLSDLNAAGYERGHRFGVAMKLIDALGLSTEEQTALTDALSTYGPAARTAMQALRAARKQLKTDLDVTPPDGSRLSADASTLAAAKTQLKAARTQLDGALKAALTPAHLQQLQAELTTQSQNSLDKKTGRLLFGYASV